MNITRKINWFVLARNNRRAIGMGRWGILVAVLVYLALSWADSQVDAAEYRLQLSTLRYEVMNVGFVGRWSPTDIQEGTSVLELRRIK